MAEPQFNPIIYQTQPTPPKPVISYPREVVEIRKDSLKVINLQIRNINSQLQVQTDDSRKLSELIGSLEKLYKLQDQLLRK
mmetsp:Transcript_17955/g.30546  ORF Transcript_17955/g.30546 Transcript_17955/m.30546 type:complete len:81 (+) Transcript_17955:659-901(+)